mgnify:CR=1 FL=1
MWLTALLIRIWEGIVKDDVEDPYSRDVVGGIFFFAGYMMFLFTISGIAIGQISFPWGLIFVGLSILMSEIHIKIIDVSERDFYNSNSWVSIYFLIVMFVSVIALPAIFALMIYDLGFVYSIEFVIGIVLGVIYLFRLWFVFS